MNWFLYATTVLIWGTTFFAITFQLGEVPVMQSAFYRFLITSLASVAFCLIGGKRLFCSPEMHFRFAALGLFLFSINYVLLYLSNQYVVSGLVALMFSLLLIFNTFMAWVFFAERPDRRLVTGVVLGLVGMASLFSDSLRGVASANGFWLGLALAVLGTFSASVGNMIARGVQPARVDVLVTNTWGMVYGTLYLFAAALLEDQPWRFETSFSYISSLLYLAIFGTLLAFWSYFQLLHRVGAARAAYTTVVFPVVALLLSTWFEAFEWTYARLLGVALIILGNLAIMSPPGRRRVGTPVA